MHTSIMTMEREVKTCGSDDVLRYTRKERMKILVRP